MRSAHRILTDMLRCCRAPCLVCLNRQLPRHPKLNWLPVQLRHARRIHDGENISMGLRLACQEERFVRRQVQAINRFITAVSSISQVQDALFIACEALAFAFKLPKASANGISR